MLPPISTSPMAELTAVIAAAAPATVVTENVTVSETSATEAVIVERPTSAGNVQPLTVASPLTLVCAVTAEAPLGSDPDEPSVATRKVTVMPGTGLPSASVTRTAGRCDGESAVPAMMLV